MAKTGIDTLSAQEKREMMEQADTLFEPLTKLSPRALELFYQLQPSIPYQMRRQRAAIASLGTLATLLDIQEQASALLESEPLLCDSPQQCRKYC